MAEIFLGVLFILGGLAVGALIFMAEMMNPTPGQKNGPDRRPAALLSLALLAAGASFLFFG